MQCRPIELLAQSQSYLQPHPTPLQVQDGRKRRLAWIIVAGISVVLIAVGIGLGVSLSKRKANSSSSSPGGSPGSPTPTSGGSSATSGKSGSVVTLEDGSKFTYTSAFGGDWAFDPKHPFSPGGKAQSWSPRVSEEWKWGRDIVRGVNLG